MNTSLNSYIQLPNLTFGNNLSISLWTKINSLQNYERVFDFGNGSPNLNIIMAVVGTSNTLRCAYFDITNFEVEVNVPNIINLNQWAHIACVFTQATVTFYSNGGWIGFINNPSGNLLPTATRTSNYIGKSNWNGNAYFDGIVDEFRIYKRPLSAQEVYLLYSLSLF